MVLCDICNLERPIVLPCESSMEGNKKICPPCLMFFCLKLSELDQKNMEEKEYRNTSINVQNRLKRMMGL